MLISLTVGKVDAGVAVLLTEDKRLIEFPSILLPPSITSGSIVDITVSRNESSERTAHASFSTLQSSILSTYGLSSPSPPILRCKNATQTSVVLEWDKISLATADLRSLSLYRNGAKAGVIPQGIQATKVSGLAVDTEYVFHLVLRTSAGVYSSEKLAIKTHKMTELSGITVTPGILPGPLRESLDGAVERIGAKIADTVRIDTTHFVCTEGRGPSWEKAAEMNIPVVRPEWIEGCEREGRIVGVRGYYLNADPSKRVVGQGVSMQQQGQQRPQQVQRTDSTASSVLPMRGSQQQQQQSQPGTPMQNQTPRIVQTSASTESPEPGSTQRSSEEHGPPLPEKDTPAPVQDVSSEDEEDDEDGRGDGYGAAGGGSNGDLGKQEVEEREEVSSVEEEEEKGLGVKDESGEDIPKTPAESLSNFSEVQL